MKPRPARVLLLHNNTANCAPVDKKDVAKAVRDIKLALQKLSYGVECQPVPNDLRQLRHMLQNWQPPHLVFNYVEWFNDSDLEASKVVRVLEESGVIFTGCSSWSLDNTNHKLKAKRVMLREGIATAPLFDPRRKTNARQRWITKCANENASFMLDDTAVTTGPAATAKNIVARRRRFGREWFAEAYIPGREFHVGLLDSADGLQVLPPCEINFRGMPEHKPHIMSHAAKFTAGTIEYDVTTCTFRRRAGDKPIMQRIDAIVRQCWQVFRLNGFARVDVRVDENGMPLIMEVNANCDITKVPGMDSGLTTGAYNAKLKFTEIIGRIVEAGIRDHKARNRQGRSRTFAKAA